MAAILDVTTVRTNQNRNVGARDLTALGPLDWFYIARTAVGDFDHKSGGTILPNNTTTLNGGVKVWFAGSADANASCSWTDGTPTASVTNELDIVFVDAGTVADRGVQMVTGALGLGRKRLVIGHSGYQPTYDVIVSISDSSSSTVTNNVVVTALEVHAHETTIVVQPTSASATLTIQLKMSSTIGNVVLQFGYVEDYPFELVNVDTFTDTNAVNITAHSPNTNPDSGVYTVGATASADSDPGSSSLTIQSNTLEGSVANQVAQFPSGGLDVVISFDWIINGTTGHQIAAIPRRLNKSNQYWLRLRQNSNDWNLYEELAGVQTSLASGTTFGWALNTTYRIRVANIGGRLVWSCNGEQIGSVTAASKVPTANAFAIGMSGHSTTGKVDNLKVWRRIRHNLTRSDGGSGAATQAGIGRMLASVPSTGGGAAVQSGIRLVLAAVLSTGGGAAVQAGTARMLASVPETGSGAATQAGILRAIAAVLSTGGGAATQAGILRAIASVLSTGSGASVQAGILRAIASVLSTGGGAAVQAGTARMLASVPETGSGAAVQSIAARFALTILSTGGGASAQSGEIVGGLNVTVITPASGGSIQDGVLIGDLIVDVLTGASGAASQSITGRFSVSVTSTGSGSAAQSVLSRLLGAVAEQGIGAAVQSGIARYLATVGQGASGGASQGGQPVLTASVSTGGAGAATNSAGLRALVTAVEVAVGAALTAALQSSNVTVIQGAAGGVTASVMLDSDRFVMLGDVYVSNRSVIYRVRSIRRR